MPVATPRHLPNQPVVAKEERPEFSDPALRFGMLTIPAPAFR